jgi:hypothetical protein
MKPRVYLETTIPSYLTAWPSRDLVRAAHQQITRDWWDRRRAEFELYISQVVVRECQAGDAAAAAERLKILQDLPLLEQTEEATGSCRPLWIECRYPSGRRSMPCTWRSRRFTEWTSCSPGIARTLPTQRCGSRSSLFAERTATSRRRFAHLMNVAAFFGEVAAPNTLEVFFGDTAANHFLKAAAHDIELDRWARH